MIGHHIFIVISILIFTIHIAGFCAAIDAVISVRTAQGAIAWLICLITLPYIALPMYLIFGRNKFNGYARAHRIAQSKIDVLIDGVYKNLKDFKATLPPKLLPLEKVINKITGMSFTEKNSAELLINGENIFNKMLERIASAKNYILIQFFIIRDDATAHIFKDLLIKKATEGVNIYFLYDEVGCHKLSPKYINSLRRHNVSMQHFYTTKGHGNSLQINFRNHRKILVVDGRCVFIGGINLGDEYLSKGKKFGFWRDTHVLLEGPCVKAAQISFVRDWHWATGKNLKLNWTLEAANQSSQKILIVPTGPEHELKSFSLFCVSLINSAEKRLWIASPYFVPDETILSMLRLAALRGVDVRILLPNRADHLLVYICSHAFYKETELTGIKIYRFKRGFMHQKVILVDNLLACVGTANLDNRSQYLNFEITACVNDKNFILQVEKMLDDDFTGSYLINPKMYSSKSIWWRFLVNLARLFSPIL